MHFKDGDRVHNANEDADVQQQRKGDLSHKKPLQELRCVCAPNRVGIYLIGGGKLLLCADVALVNVLISIRVGLFRFGDVSNKLSVKHQKLKAGKWKPGLS